MNHSVEDLTIELPTSLLTTVGRIERCGIIRVCIVSLLACLLGTDYSVVIEEYLKWNIANRVMQLLFQFPWCSAWHQAWIAFFTACFQSKQSLLWKHVLEEDGFVDVVTQAAQRIESTRCSETEDYVGYSSAVIALCLILQRNEEKNPDLCEVLSKQHGWDLLKGTIEKWKKRQNAFAHSDDFFVCWKSLILSLNNMDSLFKNKHFTTT